MDPRHLPPGVLFLAAIAALLAVLQALRLAARVLGVAAARRRLAAARERGAWGEVRAEAILRRRGFRVLGRQVGVTYGLGVDGRRIPVDLRADYVVAETGGRGRRYVAEVKTGKLAPRIDTAATRRQLLEYRMAFDVDGVLLVDAEDDRVRLVEFPLGTPGRGSRGLGASGRPPSRVVWLAAGIAAGVLATLAARAL